MLNESEVQAIIDRVQGRLAAAQGAPHQGKALEAADDLGAAEALLGDGIHATIDGAVGAAQHAFLSYRDMGLESRRVIVEAMRAAMLREGERLAYLAHAETGLGRAEDKIRKNLLVTTKTPGPEDLEPQAVTGDEGMMVTEYAPYGVIGSITPTTNPTSTIINNSLAMLAAGNAVTFNVHPGAQQVSVENIKVLNHAVVSAGGPPDLITAVAKPTLDTAKELMVHPDVRVLLVTGGPAVVGEALRTPKKAITAGPGNPPAVVDQTADIEKAGRDIVAGASFDNNIVCVDEKTTIVVDTVADALVRAMTAAGAYRLKEHELRRLERVIFNQMGAPNKAGAINPAWIGKNATALLSEIGVDPEGDVRLLIAEVPADHSLVWTEQMMPVMPVVRVNNVEAAIDLAVRSEHGFRHTASIHSTNVDTITTMARAMNCSILVANGPNYSGLGQGGEGFTSFSIASPTGEGLTRPARSPESDAWLLWERSALSDPADTSRFDPAIALLEFDSIVAGVVAGDAMAKASPIASLYAGTVHPGRYLVLVGGDTAAIEIALEVGSSDAVVDSLFLADVHPAVIAAITAPAVAAPAEEDALGAVETATAAAAYVAADAGVKAADVALLAVRLADDLGGKGYCFFGGVVADVEVAVESADAAAAPSGQLLDTTVIAQLHSDMRTNLAADLRFNHHLRAGEEAR